MQIGEKLEVFRDFTLEVARENGSWIKEEYEETCRRELEEFRKNKQAEMERKIQMEERSMRRQMNSRVSGEMLRQKHILDECKRQWKEKLMQEVQILLEEYLNTDNYKDYLIAKIQMAEKVAGKEPMIIYINKSDKDKKAELEEKTGVELTLSETDFVGGIRAIIRSRNMLIDESFLTRLEQEETYL